MKIGILGGGISGLTRAFRLHKLGYDVTVYEKSGRLGGCIDTSVAPYFFERGPRTFMVERGQALLQLIDEVGLSSEVIFAERTSRYLYYKKKLRPVPKHCLIAPLFTEWAKPKGPPDETIAEFGYRRFGKRVTDYLLEPLSLGIFAGDIHQLSVRTCFPFFKEMEQRWGSLTRGWLHRDKKAKDTRLFTLKGGMMSLIQKLSAELKVVLNYEGPSPEVDHLIEALPPKLPMNSITTVNIAFNSPVLPKEGFGYLVPTVERESILGVVFDSSVFPQQNHSPHETRLTVMLREPDQELALRTLQRHLSIKKEPDYIHMTEYKKALPQFPVGYLDTPLGQDLRSVAVSALIERQSRMDNRFTHERLAIPPVV